MLTLNSSCQTLDFIRHRRAGLVRPLRSDSSGISNSAANLVAPAFNALLRNLAHFRIRYASRAKPQGPAHAPG